MAEFRDVYRFDLSGNYKAELDRVRRGLDGVRGDWDKLKRTFAAGARFRTPLAQLAAETKGLSKEQKAARVEAERQYQAEVKLLDVSNATARAYNKVTSELNRLAVQRQADLIILGQTKKARSSIIIETRAEATALRRVTKYLEEKATAEKFAAAAAAENLQVSADGTRIFNAEAEALKKIARYQERVAVARELAARGFDASGVPATPQATPEQKVKQKAQDQFDRGLQAKQIRLETLELQKNSAAYQEVSKKLKDAQKEVKAMAKAGEETQSAFNRVSFTFRRLIGIMAAFTIARQVVSGFNAMVASAINFNSEMERARVGISGLVAAAADIRAPDGAQLGLGDQLLRAQDLAIDQMKQLRRDALETAASYEELALAFQTAVAPGLQNNLTLDQIREITVDISQAATGLGVAQNQLAEEIRSLFEGTITPRNTRVATALGISNADIRRAKELGDLFGFLQDRFAAISATGVKLMDTFSAQMSNAADSFKQLLESASKPLFLQLKAGLEDVNRAIAAITNDEVIFNEPAVRAFGELFKGLAAGVRGIRLAFSEINVQGFADSLGLVGRVLGTAATVLANGFRIAFNAVSPAISAVNLLLATVNAFISTAASFIPDFVKTILSNTTKTVVLILLAQKSLSVINNTYTKIVSFAGELLKVMQATNVQAALANANFKGLKGLIASLTVLLRKLLLPLLIIVGVISAIDYALQEMGVNFSIFDTIAEGFSFLSSQLDRMIGGAEDGKEALDNLADPNSVALLISKYAELRGEIAQLGETMSRDVVRSARDLTVVLNSLNSPQQLQQQLRAQTQAQDSLEEQIRKIETALSGSRATRNSLASPIASAGDQVDILNDKLKKLAERFAETNGGAEGLRSRIKESFNISDQVLDRYKQDVSFRNVAPTGNSRIDQIKSQAKLLDLLEREGLTLENLRNIQSDISKASNYQNTLIGQANALLENENTLLEQKNQLIAEANKLANIQVRELNANILRKQQQDLLAAQVTLTESRAAVLAATSSGVPAADALRAEAALSAAVNKTLQDRLELQEAIANSTKLLKQAQATGADNEVIFGLGQQIIGYGKLLRINEEINAERVKAAQLEKELAALRATNSVGAGVALGLEEFKASNTFNVAGQNFAKAAAGGLATFVGGGFRQIVAAAFDPNQNVDLATLARGIGVEIAAGLIEDSVRALTAELIPSLAQKLPDVAVDAASVQAPIQALGVATDSMVSRVSFGFSTAATGMAEVIGTATLGMTQAIGVAAQAAISAILAAQAASSTTSSGGGGAVLGALAGALAGTAGATGGRVSRGGIGRNKTWFGDVSQTHAHARGFAGGGRPAGLDPRDTIPAWLRPGEFVIRPEAVSRYGDWLFDLLNKGAVNPNALRGLRAGAPRSRSTASPKAGFATGGAVARPAAAGSGGSVALQFFDEQTLDRAYAAGGGSMDRFVRKRRSSFRAALGLEPNT